MLRASQKGPLMAEVKLRVTVDSREFEKGSKDVLGANVKLQKSFSRLGEVAANAFSSFAGNLAANAASAAFNKLGQSIGALIGQFGEFVDLANIQEDAINRLNTQLQISGDFSANAAQDFQEFASALQTTTRFGDEVILNQLALAKSFGATNDQAKQILEAATDLSASFGIDLESATRNVAKTLGGFAGELGEVIPELKNLGTEALQSGQGIDLIRERFRGAAQGEIKTFRGALTQTQNTIGDTKEALGGIVTTSPVVISALGGVSSLFLELQKVINDNREELQAFVNETTRDLIQAIPSAVDQLLTFFEAFQRGSSFIDALQAQFLKIAQTIVEFGKTLNETERDVTSFFGGDTSDIDARIAARQDLIDALQVGIDLNEQEAVARLSSLDEIRSRTMDLANTISEDLTQAIEESSEAQQQNSLKNIELRQAESQATKELGEDLAELSAQERVALEERRQQIEEVLNRSAQSPVDALTGGLPLPAGLNPGEQAQAERNQGLGAVAGLAGSALQGRQGAEALVTSGLSAVANKFLPGLGQALGPVFQGLTQGPAAVRARVEAFAKALPEIISNVVKAIPAVITAFNEQIPVIIQELVEDLPLIIESLIEQLPALIESLVLQTPRIILALIEEIPALVTELAKAFGEVALEFGSELINSAINFTGEIVKGAGKFVAELLNSLSGGLIEPGSGGSATGFFAEGEQGKFNLATFIRSPGQGLLDLAGIGDIGGDAGRAVTDPVGSLGRALGLAAGGQAFVKEVPAGFPNDMFRANLTSGELVVDRSTAQDLSNFLRNQKGGGTQEVIVRVEASESFVTEIEQRIVENRRLGTSLI